MLTEERSGRQLFPTTVTPALESVRPDASHDPSVDLVEELSDVRTFVVLAPTSQERVQRFDQLLGRQRHTPLRALTHLIFETPDRFLARVGIEPTRACPAADLSRRKKKSLPALDLAAEELEAVLNMNDPRLLRMQIYAQLFQDAANSVDCCSRLCRGLGMAQWHMIERWAVMAPVAFIPSAAWLQPPRNNQQV